jgi:Domain of Unknown Function (DUF1259)
MHEAQECDAPHWMGVSSVGGGKAAITGDFVLTSAEVNPVIKALREHSIG